MFFIVRYCLRTRDGEKEWKHSAGRNLVCSLVGVKIEWMNPELFGDLAVERSQEIKKWNSGFVCEVADLIVNSLEGIMTVQINNQWP